MTTLDVLSLQQLPETQPLNLPGLEIGQLLEPGPCTYSCGVSCNYTCDVITCRYHWTCHVTSAQG